MTHLLRPLIVSEYREGVLRPPEKVDAILLDRRHASIRDVHQLLTTAHEFLSRRFVDSWSEISKNCNLGPGSGACKIQRVALDVKREEVKLGSRPARLEQLLGKSKERFSEVVNQLSTLARLCDALKWSMETFVGYEVALCHPTTSSFRGDKNQKIEFDNDLVLWRRIDGIDAAEWPRIHMEVSDVVTEDNDGNDKEVKDLKSLGFDWRRVKSEKKYGYKGPTERWPERKNDQHYLVVSKEFAKYFRNHHHHWRDDFVDYDIKKFGKRGTHLVKVDRKPVQPGT